MIREAAGESNVSNSLPTSPVESRNVSGKQTYQDNKQPAPLQTQTGYQTSPITPGAGTVPGPASATTASPATMGTISSGPTSGVERSPGQY